MRVGTRTSDYIPYTKQTKETRHGTITVVTFRKEQNVARSVFDERERVTARESCRERVIGSCLRESRPEIRKKSRRGAADGTTARAAAVQTENRADKRFRFDAFRPPTVDKYEFMTIGPQRPVARIGFVTRRFAASRRR